VADARSGNTGGMNALISRAESLRQTDGQFVNTCSDALNRPTPDRVRELVVAWGKQYPQFGRVGALDMVKCLNWPSGTVPQEPEDLEIPTLLLGVRNDPIFAQPASHVAGHRARRGHLFGMRASAGDRIPGLGRAALNRHVLPGLM
jgi:hypothetical protein